MCGSSEIGSNFALQRCHRSCKAWVLRALSWIAFGEERPQEHESKFDISPTAFGQLSGCLLRTQKQTTTCLIYTCLSLDDSHNPSQHGSLATAFVCGNESPNPKCCITKGTRDSHTTPAPAGFRPGSGGRSVVGFYRVGRHLRPPCRGAAAGGAVLPDKN